ncbi:FAD:protein FMN transferase [bacterium]|nr:FAD:protein FMN transferase [bacterium]
MKIPWQRTNSPNVAATPAQPRMTRRSFLTITAVAGGLLAAGQAVNLTRPRRQINVREQRLLMGTTIHLAVVAPSESDGRAAIEATFAAMQRLIALFDYRRPDSTLSMLNRDGIVYDAPTEFTALLALAQTIGAQSAGAFDVTVQPLLDARRRGEADLAPLLTLVDYRRLHVDSRSIYLETSGMAVTLDGLAKGRVIDEAVASLRSLGYDHVLVEAGGDLAGRGSRIDAQPWRVGLAHPRNSSALLTTVNLVDAALATSGDYMNYLAQDFSAHHIVDPRTGISPSDLAAVTVLAPTATEADALSTALMVLGVERGKALLAQHPDTAALFVTKSMEEIQTEGFSA